MIPISVVLVVRMVIRTAWDSLLSVREADLMMAGVTTNLPSGVRRNRMAGTHSAKFIFLLNIHVVKLYNRGE